MVVISIHLDFVKLFLLEPSIISFCLFDDLHDRLKVVRVLNSLYGLHRICHLIIKESLWTKRKYLRGYEGIGLVDFLDAIS